MDQHNLVNMRKYIILDLAVGGHRHEYNMVLFRLIGAYKEKFHKAVFSNWVLVIPNYNDKILLYTFVVVLRALLRKRSVIISLAPGYIFAQRSWKAFVKLNCVKILSVCKVRRLSIGKGLDGFRSVPDIQLFDLEILYPELYKTILNKRKDKTPRPSVGYFGTVTDRKKASEFFEFARQYHELFDFYVIGKNLQVYTKYIKYINDKGDNTTFLTKLSEMDFVWSCTDPQNGLASGIFGRAIQLNRKVIITKFSESYDFLNNRGMLDYSHTAITFSSASWKSDLAQRLLFLYHKPEANEPAKIDAGALRLSFQENLVNDL